MRIKVTGHRVMENGCIWEGILLMNTCWVSQVLNAVHTNDGVFKKENF